MILTPKNAEKFNCIYCHFICCKKSEWNRHLITSKHKIRTNNNNVDFNGTNTCEICNTSYNSKSGLWYHKKKCKFIEKKENDTDNKNPDISNTLHDILGDNFKSKDDTLSLVLNLFREQLNDNKEFKQIIMDQNKNIVEIMSQTQSITTNNINSHNKTMNNQFNLNFFLNETCKDAMNINEFIDYVTVNLDDFENFGKVGYPKALSEIIVRNLNELDVKIRPIHCSDLKREVLHVKHDGVWHSDDSQKFIKRSITYVANKNIRQRPLWQDENPESKNCLTSSYERFNSICLASLGPATDEQEADFLKKITTTIAKEVVIDKKKKW